MIENFFYFEIVLFFWFTMQKKEHQILREKHPALERMQKGIGIDVTKIHIGDQLYGKFLQPQQKKYIPLQHFFLVCYKDSRTRKYVWYWGIIIDIDGSKEDGAYWKVKVRIFNFFSFSFLG